VGRLRGQDFRLPTGIYRNDSALGAALAFNLDPVRHAFRWERVVVVPDARYETPASSALHPRHLADALRRRWRQAQGHLETCALRAHLAQAQRPPSAWPTTTRDLIVRWAEEHPREARALAWKDPLAWAALAGLRRRRPDVPIAEGIECLGRFAGGRPLSVPSLQVRGS
jgi:hypothetical protein